MLMALHVLGQWLQESHGYFCFTWSLPVQWSMSQVFLLCALCDNASVVFPFCISPWFLPCSYGWEWVEGSLLIDRIPLHLFIPRYQSVQVLHLTEDSLIPCWFDLDSMWSSWPQAAKLTCIPHTIIYIPSKKYMLISWRCVLPHRGTCSHTSDSFLLKSACFLCCCAPRCLLGFVCLCWISAVWSPSFPRWLLHSCSTCWALLKQYPWHL